MINFVEETLLDGVTATTTSDPVNVEMVKHIGFQFLCADHASGNGVFTVEATIDGTNWVALSTLIDNVANTNAQTLTRVASKTLSADGSVLVFLENIMSVKALRVKVTVTTDGTYSAFVIAKA